jgi:hypothetical protein
MVELFLSNFDLQFLLSSFMEHQSSRFNFEINQNTKQENWSGKFSERKIASCFTVVLIFYFLACLCCSIERISLIFPDAVL